MSTLQYRGSKELREMFLSYFEERGCRRRPSSPLIPDDPTLLFTVAGMVQFKPYFMGLKTPEFTRATTSQKCIRTNDIDNVGRTARHHTFFEMLGNFSFGDYFKKEAITWAWEFLTEKVGLDPDRLYATIYLDDDEAHDMWRTIIGLPEEKIFRLGDDDNFWAAGPVGPCGPCSEIIYDQGPEFSCGKPTCGVGCDCDRYLEIWNLVFMQYSRSGSGELTPLPKKNIDTGMGLERLCSVVQKVKSNFETDLLMPVIKKACEISGVQYGSSPKNDMAVRVISDHLRASAFMIADGVLPSNEGQGYVLRRIIRRSVRYGRLLGIEVPFLCGLLPIVDSIMADQYPELIEQKSTIEQVVANEEERFGRTLAQGIDLLEAELKKLPSGGKLSGEVAFQLYDTYGFPLELTEEMCSEANVDITVNEFDAAMEQQRDRARASSKQTSAVIKKNVFTELADKVGATPFDGYELDSETAVVISIIKNDTEVDRICKGESASIVLDRTPFYAERGGQIGDKGELRSKGMTFAVDDTTHPSGDLITHVGKLTEGEMTVGMKVEAFVDSDRREEIKRHHTATHLLHEALTRVLGKHVRQAGSLVTPTFLRFDYNHFNPMTAHEIEQVEQIMCDEVLAAKNVVTHVMNIDESKKLGAKALFEEKYDDVVRVVEVPGYSTELCGGTHVRNTGNIGIIKIIREEGIGSGVRRINAVAGLVALRLFQNISSSIRQITEIAGGDFDSITSKVEEILDEKRVLEKKNQDLLLRSIISMAGDRLNDAKDIDGIPLVADMFNDVPREMLRVLGDKYKQSAPDAVIILASITDGQVALIGMAPESAVKRGVHAGLLVKAISSKIDGSGGGKPNMGQGGGRSPDALPDAIAQAEEILRSQLKG